MAKIVAETVTVMGEHFTVDLIVWRKFRQPMPGLVERILDENPGLTSNGEYLALGTTFTIPEINTSDAPRDNAVIRLWD